MKERPLPHSVSAERGVLGSILLDANAIHEIPFLRPEHFFQVKHRDIYKAMLGTNGDISGDILVLNSRLGEDDELFGYLMGLMGEATTSLWCRKHGETVWQMAKRRQLIGGAGIVADVAFDESLEIERVLDVAQGTVINIAADIPGAGPVLLSDSLSDLSLDQFSLQNENYKTGLSDLDQILFALSEGLYVIAGRPGMGKTMLGSVIALNVARAGGHVLFFSLEMSSEQLALRNISTIARVEHRKIMRGELSDDERYICEHTRSNLQSIPLWVDERGGVTPTYIHSVASRQQAQHGLDLVVIDYLQLMGGDGRYESRVTEVGAISRSLKMMSKDLGVPVIAMAQLSRSCEARQDKHPILSDLRESGAIEQDADVIMFIFREAYYDPMSMRKNVAEVSVSKNRHGETGKVELFYDPRYALFANLTKKNITL